MRNSSACSEADCHRPGIPGTRSNVTRVAAPVATRLLLRRLVLRDVARSPRTASFAKAFQHAFQHGVVYLFHGSLVGTDVSENVRQCAQAA